MKKPKPKAPPLDVRKIIRAAAEAALEEAPAEGPTKKRRLSGGRAVMLGAGLFTAGRLVVGGRGGALVNSLQDRLVGLGEELAGNKPDDVELDDEELVDEPEEEIGDLVDDDPEAAENEDVDEAEEASNGGAPERQPRRQRRGR